MKFSDLGLGEGVLNAVRDSGYETPTPIQEKAIPYVLMGRDVLGCAQTGTGKTASFTLPMIDVLAAGRAKARMPRSLILEPTRELAAQVAENFDTYGKYHKLNKALLIGGSSMNEQVKLLDRGVDVLIATPGRLLDIFERGGLLMMDVKILVIDEADRMLDMGFIPDVEKIVSTIPPLRQTLFFSATMPPEIRRLADKFLMNPKEVTVSAPASTAETITQGIIVIKHKDGKRPGGGQKEKREALRSLISQENVKNALVFCNRKRDVDTVCKSLNRHGLPAGQLHGDMSQPARMETLDKFKNGEIKLLVCSDVAARGLDVPALSHVFNFDTPTHADDYVHRIGRTGRAGKEGRAYTIATPEEMKYIRAIEQLIGKKIPSINAEGEPDGTDENTKPEQQAAPTPPANEAPAAEAAQKDASTQSPEPESDAKSDAKGDDERPKRKRRRGGRNRGGRSEDSAQSQQGASTEQKNPEQKPDRRPEQKSRPEQNKKDDRKRNDSGRDHSSRERGGKNSNDGGHTPKGLGEHTPAFLLQPVSPKKSSSE